MQCMVRKRLCICLYARNDVFPLSSIITKYTRTKYTRLGCELKMLCEKNVCSKMLTADNCAAAAAFYYAFFLFFVYFVLFCYLWTRSISSQKQVYKVFALNKCFELECIKFLSRYFSKCASHYYNTLCRVPTSAHNLHEPNTTRKRWRRHISYYSNVPTIR